jgi:UDP:flavonoid glycosyltransferase YjiC (YdhE family)
MHITGYWFPDADTEWRPAPELEAFLEGGDPPVYIGFGSMGGRHPEQLARIVLEALAKSGQRGLLLTGWGGMRAIPVPESVFLVDSAPHDRVFPQMAAVVHHGGAGTTAEGLRAGIPSVILPFVVDQPFWGRRVRALGVGPEPIPIKKLTADRLAHAIYTAVTQPQMRRRSAGLGEMIRAEEGAGNAVRIIKQVLGA